MVNIRLQIEILRRYIVYLFREHRKKRFYLVLPAVFCIILTAEIFSPAFCQASGSANRIRAIEVNGLSRIDRKEFIGLTSLRAGDVLKKSELAREIKRAFKKGEFLDIKAETAPYDGGLRLIYTVTEIPVIGDIKIAGNRAVLKKDIKKVFVFREGEDFHSDLIKSALSGLLEYYRTRGFPDADAVITAEESKKGVINIYLDINEGQPQIIRSLNISNELKGYMLTEAGDIYDREAVDRDIQRLRDHFRKNNYLKPVIGPYKFRDGELVIPVVPGMKLNIFLPVKTVINRSALMKEIPFMEDGNVTDESIQDTSDSIKNLYLKKGYYNAKVAAAMETVDNSINISFFVFKGKKVILKAVKFSNASLSSDVLESVIPLKEDKPFDATLMKNSRDALIIFYNALGYLEADVKEVKRVFHEDSAEIKLEFVMNEGVQTRIRDIRIRGNTAVSTSDITKILKLNEGDPYNIVDVWDARYSIQSLYSRRGFLDAQVEVKSMIDRDSAFLDFRITEKMRSVVGRTIIRGNRKTKQKIIEREVSIPEGEPYDYEDLLSIRQRLYKLGLFSEVKIEILEPFYSEDKQVEDSLRRDMLVTLKEAKPGAVEISLGYGDYEKLRGSIEVSYKNVGGYNRQVGFRAEANAVEKKYVLNFREPWLFNISGLPLKIYLMKEHKRAINIDTKEELYEIDRISFIAGIEKQLTKGLKAGLNYEYSFNDTKDVQPGVVLSREDTGTLAISSISPSLFYDQRDDPFDPSSGSLHGITLKFASKAYLSETEFIKGTLQSSWFFPVKNGLVFAISLKGGAGHSFGDAEELPLIERFFLGGRTTVRGYSHDTLGPKGDDDLPTGGNVFALFNTELRISMRKGFGIVTFVDAGNVWTVTKDIQPELRYTAGIGLRYRTPVGPVRIDYGHKLRREQGESAGEVHFSFGHVF